MQCEVPSSSTGEVVIVAPSVGENVYLKFLIKRLFNFYISVMFLLWNVDSIVILHNVHSYIQLQKENLQAFIPFPYFFVSVLNSDQFLRVLKYRPTDAQSTCTATKAMQWRVLVTIGNMDERRLL